MATGLEAVGRLVQERGSDLAFVVNHSGGNDSTRMLGFVRNKFRNCPTYVVMADTGFEHQRPISAADPRAIYENDHVAFEQVSHLETKLGYTMRLGAILVQIVSVQTSKPVEVARQQRFCF